MQTVPDEWRDTPSERSDDKGALPWEGQTLFQRNGTGPPQGVSEDKAHPGKGHGKGVEAERESLMMELTRLVQKTVKESSWWERRGIDCAILAAAFLSLPVGKSPPPLHD